jgi:DNA-binding NarL/FixJ family response regulator
MIFVTVLLVDDYEPFRRLICSFLSEMPDVRIIGEAADGLEAVQKAIELQPDLILLDVGLPRLSGLQAAKKIVKCAPHSKIVFLSQETSHDVVAEALRLGAFGYVAKVNAGTELEKTIHAVRQAKETVRFNLGVA